MQDKFDNPYILTAEQSARLSAGELKKWKRRADNWERGRADRAGGRPCVEINGQYLEGYHG
jgi:hypothetical protein